MTDSKRSANNFFAASCGDQTAEIDFMTKHRWLYGAVSASVLAGAAATLYWTERRAPSWVVHEHAIPVQVARAVKGLMPSVIQLGGELHPINEIAVNTRVSGRVTQVYYKVGDWVPSGAVIASVHSRELAERLEILQIATEAARADLREKEAQLVEAENQLEKTRDLYERNFIARRELDQARSALESANAQLALSKSRLAEQDAMLVQGRQLLSLTRVRAPISGVIIRRMVDPGSTVRSSVAILTIGNAEKVKVKIRGGTKDLSFVSAGMRAKVEAENGLGISAEGKILRIENRPDGAAVNTEIDIEVSSWNRKFQPGGSVTVSIPLQTPENVVWIPGAAIVETADKTYLFKLVDGRAVKTEVTVADRQSGRVAVKGLEEGDRVIVEPPASLKPDSRLKILAPVVSLNLDSVVQSDTAIEWRALRSEDHQERSYQRNGFSTLLTLSMSSRR
jgi:RND family efflux transporter MFP subunit